MKIECFPIKMKEEEALKIAAGGKNPIIRLLFGKKKINLRVMYLESRYIIYEMTYHDNFLVKAINKKKTEDKQKIRVMVEATTCTAAYVEDEIVTEEREVEENDIQHTYYEDKRLRDCGAIMARRMVRRHAGRNLSIRPVEERKVYRPFYIAIYGEMIEGTKARYMPIAADGNLVSSNF